MAEREGIENLEYLADSEALAQARQAMEEFDRQEFGLEMYQDLPPAMQPGGSLAVIPDLGRSYPGLEYHTFGQVPGEFREEFEALQGKRTDFALDSKSNRAAISLLTPKLMRKEDPVPLAGFFLSERFARFKDPDVVARAEKLAKEMGFKSPVTRQEVIYGPAIRELPSLQPLAPEPGPFVGEKFSEIPTETFNPVLMAEDETAPGFLSGPSIPSINLSRYPDVIPGIIGPSQEQPQVFSHELFHAGADHPRVQEFLRSDDVRSLPDRAYKTVLEVFRNSHKYLDPIDRYEELYRQHEQVEKNQKTETQTILDQADFLLKNPDLPPERKDIVRFMVSAAEENKDPVDIYIREVKMTPEERELLSDVTVVSGLLRNFLNETSDLKTGEKRGNLYYPPRAVPKPTKP